MATSSENRHHCFRESRFLSSARVSRVGFGVSSHRIVMRQEFVRQSFVIASCKNNSCVPANLPQSPDGAAAEKQASHAQQCQRCWLWHDWGLRKSERFCVGKHSIVQAQLRDVSIREFALAPGYNVIKKECERAGWTIRNVHHGCIRGQISETIDVTFHSPVGRDR